MAVPQVCGFLFLSVSRSVSVFAKCFGESTEAYPAGSPLWALSWAKRAVTHLLLLATLCSGALR